MTTIQERKNWHSAEAELSKADLCPNCQKGVMLPKVATDPVHDEVYHFAKCNNCGYEES